MEGPVNIAQRRLVRQFILDRHSTSLLAQAFEEITVHRSPQDSQTGAVRLPVIEPIQAPLQEISR